MIKRDTPIMQSIQSECELEVSAERREFLARKGQQLYGKYCGTQGRGICAESFAEYHIWRGEWVVVHDFLAFLRTQLGVLYELPVSESHAKRLHMTQRLIGRIQALLGDLSE